MSTDTSTTTAQIPFRKSSKSVFYEEPGSSAVTTLIIGKSRSGKTHMLTEQLNKLVGKTREVGSVSRPLFDLIVVFTESLNAEPFKNLDPNLNVLFFKSYIPKYALFLKKINDECHNKFKFLLILDDCLGSVTGKSLRGGALPRQLLTYRNANISTIVAVQSPVLLTPACRENVHQLLITGLKRRDEIKLSHDIFYDSIMSLFPEYAGKRVSKEEIAKRFFDLVSTHVLLYDNLGHKSYLIERKAFSPT